MSVRASVDIIRARRPSALRDAEVVEQTRHAHVERAVTVANGVVGEGAGKERLAHAGRSDDHHAVVVLDPG